jgi:hypothetical protein
MATNDSSSLNRNSHRSSHYSSQQSSSRDGDLASPPKRGEVRGPESGATLIDRFEAFDIAPSEFTHALHVEVAWNYLATLPVDQALSRFAEGLRRLAGHLGAVDKYHETITWAYLLLINERRQRLAAGHSWHEFARANPDLLTHRPSPLAKYYRPETLESELARGVFLLPDRLAPSSQEMSSLEDSSETSSDAPSEAP